MKNISFIITLFFIVSLSSLEKISAQPYTIKRLGMEDGLSSNYTQKIIQDQKGYIWVATSSGLNRFDGQKFILYGQDNHKTEQNWINSLLADPTNDNVWVGTDQGLFYFDYPTGSMMPHATPLSHLDKNITGLTAATDSGIWITHHTAGVIHWSAQDTTCYTPQTVLGLKGPFQTAVDDGNGNLYIGHSDKGLSIISIKNNFCKNYRHIPGNQNSLPDNSVNVIYKDKSHNIWLGTNNGLVLFNPQKESFTTFRQMEDNEHSLLGNQVADIKQMNDGTLWISTYLGGVSIFNLLENTFTPPAQAIFTRITASNDGHGLSSPNAQSIIQDSFGNIWIGNYRGGIDFISHTQPLFNTITYKTEKYGHNCNKQVWGLWADNNRQIWLGGEGELGIYKEGKEIEIIPLNQCRLNKQTHISVIHQDKHGDLWLGTHKHGVAIYHPDTKRITCIGDDKDGSLDILCFYEDTDGKIWIGTQSGLYSAYNRELTQEDKINRLLTNKGIRSILRDKNGKLWIGAKGLFLFDDKGQLFQELTTEQSFPIRSVNYLMEDSRKRIWVGTNDGILVFRDASHLEDYSHYGTKEGLQNTNVRAIQEDHDGTIWLSTNAGISRLDEKTKTFYNYNHYDGVPMGDFMDGSTCISTDGILYFGSQGGACYFTPGEVNSIRKPAPVTITQFSIYDKQTESKDTEHPLPLTDANIQLPYNQNTFKISFNVLDYAISSQVEFSYILEGLENTWYNTQGEKQIIFRNIPPGHYTFKVKTRLRNQEWEKDEATLHIRITPPFWLSWYAKLIYALLIILIIYGVSRFYKRKLDLESSLEVERKQSLNKQELNEERLRFYTNITHELRTPLTLILGPLEDLLSDATLSPKHANKISIIHDSATRLLNLINRILEFRKTETQNRKLSVAKGDLGQLVQEVGLRYKELNPNNKVNYHIHIETEDTEIFYDADMITIILDNLMSNAAKYTSEGDITLSLRSVEENQIKYTEISVSDTGHGIDAEALPHIFDRYYQAKSKYQASGSGIGLALVKGLSELHEGILKVESTVDTGTTFTLRLLTENTYPNAIHAQHDMEKKPMDAEETTITDTPTENHPIVLVVEDNADIREYIRSSFTDIYEVITAKDGKEGRELAQARIPNIIVSDIMMPVMDGIELCKRIKEDMRTSHIPVILLTAKDSLQDKEEGYASGADSYLTKPFSAKLLHSRINNLLETRKKIASLLALADIQPKQESAVSSLNKLDNEFLQKITQIIEENLEMEKMDIAFIADKMCMSHSTLYRKIKGLTDMSANEFIRKVKMRKGVELLMSGQYTISEIAYMIGFSSVAYFRQCFKDEYGMSPSDYVKQKQ